MRKLIAWGLAGSCVVFAVARVLGLERGWPWVALMAFTPFVVPGALLAAGIAAALRVHVAAAVALAAALVLGALVAPRALGGDTGARGPALRVMTSNVFVARGDPATLVRLARRERVDVLSVQEVDAGYLRRLDAAGIRAVLPHRLARLGRGTSGTVLYADRRLRQAPRAPYAGVGNPVAAALVDVGDATAEVAAVHPPPPIARVVDRRDREILGLPGPAGDHARVLAGDFNATLDHRPLRRLLARGYADAAASTGAGLRATWPVGRHVPPVTIDHVLASGAAGFRDVAVHPLAGSDHRTVTATVVLRAP